MKCASKLQFTGLVFVLFLLGCVSSWRKDANAEGGSSLGNRFLVFTAPLYNTPQVWDVLAEEGPVVVNTLTLSQKEQALLSFWDGSYIKAAGSDKVFPVWASGDFAQLLVKFGNDWEFLNDGALEERGLEEEHVAKIENPFPSGSGRAVVLYDERLFGMSPFCLECPSHQFYVKPLFPTTPLVFRGFLDSGSVLAWLMDKTCRAEMADMTLLALSKENKPIHPPYVWVYDRVTRRFFCYAISILEGERFYLFEPILPNYYVAYTLHAENFPVEWLDLLHEKFFRFQMSQSEEAGACCEDCLFGKK